MKELLQMLDFTPEEVKKEMPRIQKGFDKLSITAADVDAAKERLEKYYEIDRRPMKMMNKIWLREMVNLTLARDDYEKVVYVTLPAVVSDFAVAAMKVNQKVYGSFPDLPMIHMYAGLFRKMDRAYEAAERKALNQENAHCGDLQAIMGMLLLDLIPKPDFLFCYGTFCDDAPKCHAFLGEMFDFAVAYLDRVQDQLWDEEGVQERDVEYLAGCYRRGVDQLSKVIATEIKDEVLWQVMNERAHYVSTINKITELNINADPVPLSMNTLWLLFALAVCSATAENRELRQEAADLLLEETQRRVERGEGFYQKGAPRIIPGSFNIFVDFAFDYLLRDVGLAVPLFEGNYWLPDAETNPELPDEPDVYRLMAFLTVNLCVLSTVRMRIKTMEKAIKKYNLDGLLGLPSFTCRPYMADAVLLKDGIKRLGIPATTLECDLFDYRHYSVEQQRTRVESFAELCKVAKAKKMAKAA